VKIAFLFLMKIHILTTTLNNKTPTMHFLTNQLSKPP